MATNLVPVPKEKITEMTTLYANTIWAQSTANLQAKHPEIPGIQEAKSAWLSRKELNQLLDDNSADGLRIYYGCHNESTTSYNPDFPDMMWLHNVILVATKSSNGDPTVQNSVDQLSEGSGALSAGAFTGNGGDFIPICPPICP